MTPTHKSHYDRCLERIPWATQTNGKRYDLETIPSRPPFIQRAKGCRLWDLDGKEYIDYRASLGPIILGYQYPEIDDAVRKQMENGVLFSMASPLEIEATEAIIATAGWPDKLRFMKTGADATSACLRLARAHTGREHFLTSGYHGYQDWFAFAWSNNGVPSSLEKYAHAIDYGDVDAVETVFNQFGDDLAAAIVSPVEWYMQPSSDYLGKLREKCTEHGTLLIFDEILTGFRLAKGGAQAFFGVTPDLVAYAKGMANGYPLSAYAGSAKYMDQLDDTIITTTYAGETLSLAASIAVMKVFNNEPVHQHLFALGQRLRDGFDAIFKELGFPAKTVGLAPAVNIKFEGSSEEQSKQRAILFEQLFQRGIFANKEWFITYSHQESDIDETLEKMRDSVKALK